MYIRIFFPTESQTLIASIGKTIVGDGGGGDHYRFQQVLAFSTVCVCLQALNLPNPRTRGGSGDAAYHSTELLSSLPSRPEPLETMV